MKTIIFITALFVIVSCELIKVEEKIPYYSFDSNSKNLLTEIKLNETVKFIGSDGSKKEFTILRREEKKQVEADCGSLFGYSCTNYYYYDEIYIAYQHLDGLPISGNLRMATRLDNSISKRNIPKGTIAKTKLQGEFYGFNCEYDFPYLKFPALDSLPKFEIFSNSVRTFNNVIVFKSGRNEPIIDRWSKYERNISEVGFDMKYGVVYFKDLKGTIWKRIN